MIEKISHSALRDYLRCPKLFYYRHVLKLNLPESPIDLVFGKALHKALELKDSKDMKKTFISEFKKELIDEKAHFKYEELSRKGLEFCERFRDEEDFLSLRINKTEHKISKTGIKDPSSGLALKFNELVGVIDFLSEDGSIGDYKTSSHTYSQKEVDESLQPTMYYLLHWLEYGTLPTKFKYVVFLKKRKTCPIQVLTTTRTKEDITNLIKTCNEVYDKVEKREFKRSHGLGEYCDCFKFEELIKV